MGSAETITAAIELVASVVGLVAILFTLFRVEKVHALVNSQFTAAMKRIDQLTAALERSDTEVPEEPDVE